MNADPGREGKEAEAALAGSQGEGVPAIPNDDDTSAVREMLHKYGVFIYEVDFGDEGKGRYVRLNDFTRVVAKLTPGPAAPDGDGSRESRMAVVKRNESGTPTVWCDPEIVDLVTALNAGGIPTVASCSGHGEQHGNIALRDGRELLIAPNFEAARKMDAALSDQRVSEAAPYGRVNPKSGEFAFEEDCENYPEAFKSLTVVVYTHPPTAIPDGMVVDDTARMDYMQANPGQFSGGQLREQRKWWFHAQGFGYFQTIREAIDAARAAAPGSAEGG